MTKAEEFDKARRLAYKGDFSVVEKLLQGKVVNNKLKLEKSEDSENEPVLAEDQEIYELALLAQGRIFPFWRNGCSFFVFLSWRRPTYGVWTQNKSAREGKKKNYIRAPGRLKSFFVF